MSSILLTDLDARPGADVVIYDGHCRICTGQVRLLARLDLVGQLSFLSLHDARTGARYPDLSYDELMKQMYVVDRAGRRHGGVRAVQRLSRRMPVLWPLAVLLHLPGTLPFWHWLYQQIASRRYRFGRMQCDDGTCHLH
jgi:predicted DCC family thiol-disulfide oxidoreductase YuxK